LRCHPSQRKTRLAGFLGGGARVGVFPLPMIPGAGCTSTLSTNQLTTRYYLTSGTLPHLPTAWFMPCKSRKRSADPQISSRLFAPVGHDLVADLCTLSEAVKTSLLNR